MELTLWIDHKISCQDGDEASCQNEQEIKSLLMSGKSINHVMLLKFHWSVSRGRMSFFQPKFKQKFLISFITLKSKLTKKRSRCDSELYIVANLRFRLQTETLEPNSTTWRFAVRERLKKNIFYRYCITFINLSFNSSYILVFTFRINTKMLPCFRIGNFG